MRQLIPPLNLWFLPALALRVLLYLVVRLLYGVEVMGRENIPRQGPVLLVANHVSYVDVLLLQAAYPRHIHFVAHEFLFRIWWLGWFLRLMGVVAIQPRNARQAFRQVRAELERGHVVCLFPEGQLSQTGFLQRLKPGFTMLAKEAGCPVQPVAIDGIWGSCWSFGQGCFWGKPPLPFRHSVRLNFGPVLWPDEFLMDRTRDSLLDLAADAFSRRRPVTGGFAGQIIRRLAHRPWMRQLVTHGPVERESCSRGRLLGTAIAYARSIRAGGVGVQIGGAGQSGIPAAIERLAAMLAGEVGAQRAVDGGGGKGAAGQGATLGQLANWRVQVWVALVYLLPGRLLARWVAAEPTDESVAIGAGVDSLAGANLIRTRDVLLRQRPSFGVVDFWHPLAAGIPMVTVCPSGPDAGLPKWTGPNSPTVITAPAEFLEQCLLQEGPGFFRGIRFVVIGPDRVSRKVREAFERRFVGLPIYEEFRLKGSLGPFCLNVPDAPGESKREEAGSRGGSIGRLLPGFTARIVDLEDGGAFRLGQAGRLWLKGPGLGGNVSPGRSGESCCLPEGPWHDTGETARFDDDGFVFIAGHESPGGKATHRMSGTSHDEAGRV